MQQFKVMIVLGTRPEIIKMSRVIAAIDACPAMKLTLVHTGQNFDYELNQVFFDDLKIRAPNHFLSAAGVDAIGTIANVIVAIQAAIDAEKPEAFVLLGDTNSCLCALTAKKMKVPIFHLEAGNRCFDERVPEEVNRKIIDHLSDINLPYSALARANLIKEGLPPDRVITIGSPMREIFQYYAQAIADSQILPTLKLELHKYFLVSTHREENVSSDGVLRGWTALLNHLAELYQFPVIVSTHPRTRKRIESLGLIFHSRVQLLKPLNFTDYNRLQKDAFVVLSDSGTISEDSSILNFPALNLRESHERPEAMEEGTVMLVGMSQERILQALRVLETQKRGTERDLRMVRDYEVENVSQKVLRIILSYTDYVNRNVWKK